MQLRRCPAPLPVLLFLFLALPAMARSTDACFSEEEGRQMVQKRDAFSRAASDCLKKYWETHLQFFRKNRYSRYFGNRNKDIDTPDKRKRYILLALWPDFPRLLKSDEQKALMEARQLSDFEKFLQQKNPALFADYQQKIQTLHLDERAAEEKGTAEQLRPGLGPQLQNISCVDMARRCLSEGFKAAGMEQTWAKIDAEVRKADLSGVVLQKALGDLGWKIYYWNPDPLQNAAFDLDDQKINPLRPPKAGEKPMVWQGSWGGHASRHKGVMEKDEYYLGRERPLPIDDKKLLVGFGESPPAAFQAVPFFVGTAHSGYHVFPGFSGRIIEAHSMRSLLKADNLEMSSFNPLAQKRGGGPVWTNSERYRSGVIVIPPGYIENGPIVLHKPQMDGSCIDIRPSRVRPASP